MERLTAIGIITLLLAACGGGGVSNDVAPSGGGGGSPEPGESGFPDVAGRYSFNTNQIGVSCSDGSSTSNPPIALNFDILQEVNVITMFNTNTDGVPGITFIESTDASGNVQMDSSFIITQNALATISGISGTVNVAYNITGSFSGDGWSGNYVYTASSTSLGSCTFTTNFTGTKIPDSVSAISVSESLDTTQGYPLDIYDSFSVLGSSMATE
jgi:hypothetical protein